MKECICTPPQIQRYLAKISGPLLDRIDLHVDVPEVKYDELTRDPDGEPSHQIAERVEAARARQLRRFKGKNIFCNAQMGSSQLHQYCSLTGATKKMLQKAIQRLAFSARAYDRILKRTRTTRGAQTLRLVFPKRRAS